MPYRSPWACVIVGALGVTLAGTRNALTTLLKIKGAWDQSHFELSRLVEKVGQLITQKELDHQRLSDRDDHLEARIERHEAWYDKH